MRKIFRYSGLIVIVAICFLYTEKAAVVVKNVDNIMLKIREKKELLDKDPIQAIIKGNTIIPGISGYEIDVNKSYQKMRYMGEYNENYLVYHKLFPSTTIEKNKDNIIISGNNLKKEVSIILVLKDLRYLDFIKNVNQDLAVFVDANLVEKDLDKLSHINNICGTIGYNYDYSNPSYLWVDSKIKQFSKSDNVYCLINDLIASTCEEYNSYTIYGRSIKTNHLRTTKKDLTNGNILVYDVNETLIKELAGILKFIESKGYEIVKLDDLLKEWIAKRSCLML